MLINDRDTARDYFFTVWQKHKNGNVLEGTETMLLSLMLIHPEYQAIFSDPEKYREYDYDVDQGEVNPFLHLSLHMAIEEQLSIDKPDGISTAFQKLLAQIGDAHEAKHRIMGCLAQGLWDMQQQQQAFDDKLYMHRIYATIET